MSKINYGSMVYARVMIVSRCAVPLAKAVTIATRYSVIRRQSGKTEGYLFCVYCYLALTLLFDRGHETQLMDYQMQQYKLLPLLATTYAFYSAGEVLTIMYEQVISRIADNEFDLLPEVHIITCIYAFFL